MRRATPRTTTGSTSGRSCTGPRGRGSSGGSTGWPRRRRGEEELAREEREEVEKQRFEIKVELASFFSFLRAPFLCFFYYRLQETRDVKQKRTRKETAACLLYEKRAKKQREREKSKNIFFFLATLDPDLAAAAARVVAPSFPGARTRSQRPRGAPLSRRERPRALEAEEERKEQL